MYLYHIYHMHHHSGKHSYYPPDIKLYTCLHHMAINSSTISMFPLPLVLINILLELWNIHLLLSVGIHHILNIYIITVHYDCSQIQFIPAFYGYVQSVCSTSSAPTVTICVHKPIIYVSLFSIYHIIIFSKEPLPVFGKFYHFPSIPGTMSFW